MKARTACLAVATSALCGLLVGVFSGKSDRVGRFNSRLLAYSVTNDAAAFSSQQKPHFGDLLAVWRGLAATDEAFQREIRMAGNWFRLTEGAIARKYATERLLPAFYGVLRSLGISSIDYFELELLLLNASKSWPVEDRTNPFFSAMADREPVIRGMLGNYGVSPRFTATSLDNESQTIQLELIVFLRTKYQSLSDFDLELMGELIRLPRQHSGEKLR
jgi:hypothetical protein